MQIRLLRSKLHMAAVTATHLTYPGSISIDRDLIDAAGMYPYEVVLVANCSTGTRAETYVIESPRGSGEIQLNGAMARLAERGDRLIIISYALVHPEEVPQIKPRVVVLDEQNRITDSWLG